MMTRILGLAGLLAVAAGCTDPTSPPDVTGTYLGTGRSLDVWAESLPADGYEYQIVADTVALARDRTGVHATTWRRRAVPAGDTTSFQSRVRFTYEVRGDQVWPTRTGCEGDCVREPLLGMFTVAGAELRSSVHVFVTFQRISRETP